VGHSWEGSGQREEAAEEGRDGVSLKRGFRDASAVGEAGERRGAEGGGGQTTKSRTETNAKASKNKRKNPNQKGSKKPNES
jgi:hypothetical protein